VALASHPDFTSGQRSMIRQFSGSGNTIDIGVGAAGTGKTTVMTIIERLATETGTPVMGTALAARVWNSATEIWSRSAWLWASPASSYKHEVRPGAAV
jgi:ABC-type glutathione transport system ATPase component